MSWSCKLKKRGLGKVREGGEGKEGREERREERKGGKRGKEGKEIEWGGRNVGEEVR